MNNIKYPQSHLTKQQLSTNSTTLSIPMLSLSLRSVSYYIDQLKEMVSKPFGEVTFKYICIVAEVVSSGNRALIMTDHTGFFFYEMWGQEEKVERGLCKVVIEVEMGAGDDFARPKIVRSWACDLLVYQQHQLNSQTDQLAMQVHTQSLQKSSSNSNSKANQDSQNLERIKDGMQKLKSFTVQTLSQTCEMNKATIKTYLEDYSKRGLLANLGEDRYKLLEKKWNKYLEQQK